jgi:hypothetical protein
MKQDKQDVGDTVSKQIAAHSKALGRDVDPERVSGVQRAKDGEPYTSAERAPADPLQGPLSWNSGQPVTSPLTRPEPDHFGARLTPSPRRDQGQRSGVDDIVRGS